MAKQAAAKKPQRQYLNVKFNVDSDGMPKPIQIIADDEEYVVEVLRSREISASYWRYTIRVGKQEFYMYYNGTDWWIE